MSDWRFSKCPFYSVVRAVFKGSGQMLIMGRSKGHWAGNCRPVLWNDNVTQPYKGYLKAGLHNFHHLLSTSLKKALLTCRRNVWVLFCLLYLAEDYYKSIFLKY